VKINRLVLASIVGGFQLLAQKPYRPAYNPDVAAPSTFRANRNSYSAIVDVLKTSLAALSQNQVQALKGLQFENIWKALGDYQGGYVRGFKSTQTRARLIGRAVTIRFLPVRPDLRRALETLAKEGDWPAGYYQRAAEDARPGDVMVVEAGGEHGSVFMGDMSALGIKLSGAAGVVIDGLCRDLAQLQTDEFKDFPVFARAYDVHGAEWMGAEWNVPVRIDNVTVLPGDVVVAEEEGILFFPSELLGDVIQKASEIEAQEIFERSLILKRKYRFRDVYPPVPELLKEFESKKGSRKD
jgi:regulator of RNase E activity RraA